VSTSLLLVLSGMVLALSVAVLIRKRPAIAPTTFLLLAFLHALTGTGYLFIGMYRHWSWGERYSSWADVDLTETTYFYVLAICLTLLVLSYIRLRSSVIRAQTSTFRLRPFSVYELFIALLFVSIYIMGIKLGTLRVGLGATIIVLPFRLNGVIEIVSLFLLPLYISLRIHRLRGGFWLGIAVMVVYGTVNLTSFGSKNSAIYPLAVFMSVALLSGRLKVTRLLVPAMVIFSLYTFINPWYFRQELRQGTGSSRMELMRESAQTVRLASYRVSPLQHGLVAMHNLSHRMTGIVAMQCAIDDSVSVWESITVRGIVLDVGEYYNQEVVHTRSGSSNATGHFAFFMFVFGNHVLGFCVGLSLLVVFFYICLRLDRRAAIFATPRDSLLGLTVVLMLLPLLHDGNYDNVSEYIHLVASLLAVRFIFLRLLAEPLPPESLIGKSQTTSHEHQIRLQPTASPSLRRCDHEDHSNICGPSSHFGRHGRLLP